MAFSRGRYQLGVPGRFAEQVIPLIALIQLAYDVWAHQVVEGPVWVRSARYAIDARASNNATLQQMRPMFRALLAERFKLVLHRDTRPLPVYELLPVSRGSKLVPMKDGECVTLGPDSPRPKLSLPPAPMPNICGWGRRIVVSNLPRVDRIEAVAVPMSDLINWLSSEVGRVVVDRTEFTEKFSYRLEFTTSQQPPTGDSSVAAAGRDLAPSGVLSAAPTLFDALKDQLGLELKQSTAPVEVLVIDSVERPTPD